MWRWLLLGLLWPALALSQTYVADDEFSGKLNSWGDIKADYGAVGNGTIDDTAKFQTAVNDLGTSGKPSVLYVPAGTYRIETRCTPEMVGETQLQDRVRGFDYDAASVPGGSR